MPWAANQVNMVCALERLNTSNSGVASCLQNVAEQLHGLTIYEYLSKPARRAAEFHQICTLLLNKTPPGHEDYACLQSANEVMARVKEALHGPNEEFESLLKIVGLQNSLQGQESLVAPNRRYIRDWCVACWGKCARRGVADPAPNRMVNEVSGKKLSEKRLHLLSDALVAVKHKRTGVGQAVCYPLGRCAVRGCVACACACADGLCCWTRWLRCLTAARTSMCGS